MTSLIPWRVKRDNTAPVLWNDDWFGRVWENPFKHFIAPFSNERFSHLPKVDVHEDKTSVSVRAEIPGMSEKDIQCTWNDGVLRIHGEKKNDHEEKKNGRRYRECSYGSFSRDIPLGDNVDWKGAKAKYRSGVLTVTLPKTAVAKKSITVKIN